MENEKAHRKSGSYVFRKVAIYSSVAAAAVICVTLAFTSVSKKAYNRGLYAHIQEMPVNMTEYSTSNGEIRRVTLPDSSKRWFRAHLPGTVRGRRKGGVPER